MMSMDPFSHFNALNAAAASAVAEKISGQLPGVNKRVYYCQRCLNHGRLEPRKNHKCECTFASCTCTKCILVEKRRVLNTQLHELEESVEAPGNENSVDGASSGGVGDSGILDALSADDMSLLDDKNDFSGVGRIKGERVPNCQKCGQHGRKSRLKGHKRVCPFKDCDCPKCQVVTERQKLMADQIKIRRRQRKDTIMNLTREKITATLNAAAAVAAAGPLPYLNNLSMIYNQLNPATTAMPGAIPMSSATASTSPMSTTTFSLPPVTATSTVPPTPTYMQTPSEALLKAAVAMSSSSTEPICTSPMQLSNFPLFQFNSSQSAALAALTGTSSPPALPVSAKTEVKSTEILEISHSPSPSGSSPPSLDNAFCGLAGISKISTPPASASTVTLPQGMPTQEQLLAFLANVQFTGVFPGMSTASPAITTESLADSIAKVVATSADAPVTTTSTSFVDVCSV